MARELPEWTSGSHCNKSRKAWASVTRDLCKCRTPNDLKYGSDFHLPPLISACATKEQTLSIYSYTNKSLFKRKPSRFWKYVGVGHLQDILNFGIWLKLLPQCSFHDFIYIREPHCLRNKMHAQMFLVILWQNLDSFYWRLWSLIYWLSPDSISQLLLDKRPLVTHKCPNSGSDNGPRAAKNTLPWCICYGSWILSLLL